MVLMTGFNGSGLSRLLRASAALLSPLHPTPPQPYAGSSVDPGTPRGGLGLRTCAGLGARGPRRPPPCVPIPPTGAGRGTGCAAPAGGCMLRLRPARWSVAALPWTGWQCPLGRPGGTPGPGPPAETRSGRTGGLYNDT